MFSLGHVSRQVVDRFIGLGAVEAACMLQSRYHYYSGYTSYEPFTDIVYFFDDQRREIGYWSVLTPFNDDEPQIFAPHYRVWHESFLAKLDRLSL